MSDSKSQEIKIGQFDKWLTDDSEIAALTMREYLESVEGADAIIFPPTYAKPEGMRPEDWPGYNIDQFSDGSSVCTIDSVGAQANRMEPIFCRGKYVSLVPQVRIKAGQHIVHLLEAGHRAADAIVRFAGKQEDAKDGEALAKKLWDAFVAWQEHGDAEILAKIAPTSIVFGAWDSRATQAKIPRIVRSVIRAYNVKRCTRSAQFNTPFHYVDEGLIENKFDIGEGEKNPLAQEGFRHSPAPAAHGGILVEREIRRDASLNLVALRALGVRQGPEESQNDSSERLLKLRRYILGLAMVAVTGNGREQHSLREGCLLRTVKTCSWRAVPFRGDSIDLTIDNELAFRFATLAATEFGVANDQFAKPFLFDSKKVNEWLAMKKDDRDKQRHRGPVVS